jgi:integrase
MRTSFHIEKRRDGRGKLLSADRPVLMSVTFGGKRVILGTGLKIDLNGWDTGLQRIQASYPESRHLNNWLKTMEEVAGKTMEALQQSDNEAGPESFRQMFKQFKPKYSSGFFSLFFEFMESNSPNWSNATYRKIRTLYNLLRELEDQSGIPISFTSMNAQFLERFLAYCQTLGYKYSTTYKSVNNLVWFLNWATDKGYNIYRDYRKFYKLMDAPEDNSKVLLYLHWDELMRFMEYGTNKRREERVRDLFCFMCFTGLRFSELQRLKKEDLKEGQVLIRKPGGGVRTIPLNKFARKIHQKYENKYFLNNTAFPGMSMVTMNKYLRIIGKELGFNRLVYSGIDTAGLPLYNRLTAGAATQTFIKNALELEIPVEVISQVTGVQKDSRVRRIISNMTVEAMEKFNA